MKLTISVKNFINGVVLCMIFVLLDRTMQLASFSGTFLFSIGSRIATVLVLFACIMAIKRIKGNVTLNVTFAYTFYMLITTLLNHNSTWNAIASLYPVLGMCMFMVVECSSMQTTQRFVKAISNMYVLMTTINLIFIIVAPDLFGPTRYFMGLRNQIGYTLVIGELFVYLDWKFSGPRSKIIFYNAVALSLLLLIFSGSNMVGLGIFALYFVVPPFQHFIKKHDITWFLILYVVVWISVVALSSSALLNLPFIKYIIEDVLGKNVTLTSRTYIWEVAIVGFLSKPWLGHGMSTTENVFYIHREFTNRIGINSNYSAHNQLLQSLYEIGIVGVGVVAAMVIITDKRIKKCKNDDITGIFRIAIIVTLVMMLAEAPGLYSLIIILNFATIISRRGNEMK